MKKLTQANLLNRLSKLIEDTENFIQNQGDPIVDRLDDAFVAGEYKSGCLINVIEGAVYPALGLNKKTGPTWFMYMFLDLVRAGKISICVRKEDAEHRTERDGMEVDIPMSDSDFTLNYGELMNGEAWFFLTAPQHDGSNKVLCVEVDVPEPSRRIKT